MDYKEMANKIYDFCSDMDYEDYEDTREEETNLIASALNKLEEMEGADFKALFNALSYMFKED